MYMHLLCTDLYKIDKNKAILRKLKCPRPATVRQCDTSHGFVTYLIEYAFTFAFGNFRGPARLVSFTVTALIGLVTLTFDLLSFDLKIGTRVTRVMGFHTANFGLPRLFRSRVRSMHATEKQTDGRTDTSADFIMPSTYGGRGLTRG